MFYSVVSSAVLNLTRPFISSGNSSWLFRSDNPMKFLWASFGDEEWSSNVGAVSKRLFDGTDDSGFTLMFGCLSMRLVDFYIFDLLNQTNIILIR